MGSLHKGHVSLIKKSLKKCKKTLVSIFVNPTQFNNKNDYKKYPKNLKKDLFILRKLNVDFLYIPKKKHIYDTRRKIKVKLDKYDKVLCAKYRKGHFEGVIDVMDRLTNKIKPKKIFMGEKDFQQLHLVKKYIRSRYKSQIISCKTIRDSNKLALSSRNILLSKKELSIAGKLAQNIITYKKKLAKKNKLEIDLNSKKNELVEKFKIFIEYFELRNIFNLRSSNDIGKSKLFIAYYINNIRLIDNF